MERISYFTNKKFIVLAVVSIVAVLICVLAVNKVSASQHSKREKMVTSVVVKEGDSLWEIANEYYSDEYESIDDYIEDIMKTNNISSTNIIVGNSLIIPYYEQ